MYWVLVLWIGYLSYVLGTSLMYWVLVLCIGYQSYVLGISLMFFVLGFLPGYILARVLHAIGKLRIPREVELAGLDYQIIEDASSDEKAVASSSR